MKKTAYEIILVASTDEEICGVVVLNFITPMHEDGCWGVISALVVDEIKRGAGIGHRLLAEAEAAAKANGCSKIELASSMKRERAHKFYENHGYEEKRKRYIKLLISP
ncbi:GNAT family N-acetyltransferase [Paenochrobactrum pullorum]|uniref:GNAT family N-acetyltransferase n=1 Tax=Paenochrobactrum pullorum TaxID=1324351 RepID=UPI0035BC8879